LNICSHSKSYTNQFNEKLLSKDLHTKVEAIKQDIIAGKIQVPDFYLEKNKK
jgi:basic membrane lipoprotein Med (substrate-binding protein (PBP1-ABC) superfamily)